MSTTLSPPDKTSSALGNLTGTAGALVDAFDDIIRLPYADSVRLDAIDDRSVTDVILELKKKYQDLQGTTLPIARDLYGYAGLQITTIPQIEKAIPLQTYLDLNKAVITRHKLEASIVKRDSEAFRKEFAAAVDLFNDSIEELNEKIAELDKSIQDTEDEYEKEKSAAIIAGVLTGLLVTAAIISIAVSAGAVTAGGASSSSALVAFGAKLAAAGGTSGVIGTTAALSTGALTGLTTTIITSINAGNLKDALNAMESLQQSTIETRDHLMHIIGMMEAVETSLDDIVSIWTDVEDSLTFIQNDVEAWKETNFSQDFAAPTVEEWEEVRDAIQKYTSVVSGERSLKSLPGADEKAHETEDSQPENEGEIFIAVARSMAQSELKLSFRAPDLEFEGRLSDFQMSFNALKKLIAIEGIDSSVKSKAENSCSLLLVVQKGLTKSAKRLGQVSQEREMWLRLFESAESSARTSLIKQLGPLTTELDNDLKEATETEGAAFKYQAAVGMVNNLLIRQIGEKQTEQQALMRRLREVEKDRKNRKWLWIVPIAGAINELVDLANNLKGKINRIKRHIKDLGRLREQLTRSSKSIKSAVKDSTKVVQTFSQILNDTQSGVDDAVLFETLGEDIPAELLVSAKETWVELRNDIDDFMQ